MKIVYSTDQNGLKHAYNVPDDFTGKPEQGLPIKIPDLTQINWAELRKKIHNLLVENNLTDIASIKSDEGNRVLHRIVAKTIVDELFNLYKRVGN